MAKAKSKIAPAKTSEPEREGNRYTRAARVLAKDDAITVKGARRQSVMSETTAARCLEAWRACVGALIEVGRLPDPAKPAAKKATLKPKPATPVAKPFAATETTVAAPPETAEAI
jgi:hypothetical protein